jgi:TPR repeat protein
MPNSGKKALEQTNRRIQVNDANAYFNLGCIYFRGGEEVYNLKQDRERGLELWRKGAELGSAKSYYQLGAAHRNGAGVKQDEKKGRYYYELAAIGGDVAARYKLGVLEEMAGNMDKAIKHSIIAAGFGHAPSLKFVKVSFLNRRGATKGDYEKALRAYQEYLEAVRSGQRDGAARLRFEYQYLIEEDLNCVWGDPAEANGFRLSG